MSLRAVPGPLGRLWGSSEVPLRQKTLGCTARCRSSHSRGESVAPPSPDSPPERTRLDRLEPTRPARTALPRVGRPFDSPGGERTRRRRLSTPTTSARRRAARRVARASCSGSSTRRNRRGCAESLARLCARPGSNTSTSSSRRSSAASRSTATCSGRSAGAAYRSRGRTRRDHLVPERAWPKRRPSRRAVTARAPARPLRGRPPPLVLRGRLSPGRRGAGGLAAGTRRRDRERAEGVRLHPRLLHGVLFRSGWD